MAWKPGATSGQVIVGVNGAGNNLSQLTEPSDVIIDGYDLIVCDTKNQHIMRWPRQTGKTGGIVVPNVTGMRLTMDNQGDLYVADCSNHVVRRYEKGETSGTIIAGQQRVGNGLRQLNWPTFMYVDDDSSVYISDNGNHRVVKWKKNAREGVVVAGGNRGDAKNDPTQFAHPDGLIVDSSGTIYIADNANHRVMRWRPGATEGEVIVGGNGPGSRANQLRNPQDLTFDGDGNLYVVDWGNHRVQRFDIE